MAQILFIFQYFFKQINTEKFLTFKKFLKFSQ